LSYEDGLQFRVRARPQNVAVVRRAVAVRADELGMDRERVIDLSAAVSEACANAVLHAYESRDEPGLLEVELIPGDHELSVVVRDFGDGVSSRPSAERPSLRMGLGMIGALSNRFQLVSVLGEGTEVTIHASYAAERRSASTT
jgi:anti-sigma regulatory factor (Ser/Thr protein kinase)